MPDKFTHTTRHSYGSRIVNSIKGIFVGLLIFIISFGVLFWNEGRVDVSKIAETAIQISSEEIDASANNKLVSTYGTVKSEEVLGDGLYIKPGDYLSINRKVEMFAWIERSETTTESNLGGSETETTTYTYYKDWTQAPTSTSSFEHPEGHENPQKLLDSKSTTVNTAKIGVYELSPQKLSLSGSRDLNLNHDIIDYKDDIKLKGNYIFKGKGKLENPKVGDIRVSYTYIPNNSDGTIFGKLNKNKIDPFVTEDARLYRMFSGTHDEAISKMATEHSIMTWILRLIGFLLMWSGLKMVFGPISILLDVVPFFGSVSKMAIGGISFIVALILSIITIIISIIFHNIWALLAIILITAGVMFYLYKTKAKNK